MKPILFNTEMVRAILDGRKTETRRVVKGASHEWDFVGLEERPYERRINADGEEYLKELDWPHAVFSAGREYCDYPMAKSHCRPGDILYVRETWSPVYVWPKRYLYKADADAGKGEGAGMPIKWHPSIHMPKKVARLFLLVKGVRVERLRDITEDGAKQEGIQYTDFGTYLPNWKMSIDGGKTFHRSVKWLHYHGYHVGQANSPDQCYPTARGAYHALWNSTIKPADHVLYGWSANPWVWVIEFERITKEEAEDG